MQFVLKQNSTTCELSELYTDRWDSEEQALVFTKDTIFRISEARSIELNILVELEIQRLTLLLTTNLESVEDLKDYSEDQDDRPLTEEENEIMKLCETGKRTGVPAQFYKMHHRAVEDLILINKIQRVEIDISNPKIWHQILNPRRER